MNPSLFVLATLVSTRITQAAQGSPPAISAAPADVDSINHIVAALYDVISGPAGAKRNWDRMRSLFTPGAMMGAVFQTKNGVTGEADFSVERYITGNDPVLMKEGFFEREVSRKSEAFGHIAHVFSTYESRHVPGEKPFERGINSIQLYNDGKRWWVRTILWEGETATLKLPRKYTR